MNTKPKRILTVLAVLSFLTATSCCRKGFTPDGPEGTPATLTLSLEGGADTVLFKGVPAEVGFRVETNLESLEARLGSLSGVSDADIRMDKSGKTGRVSFMPVEDRGSVAFSVTGGDLSRSADVRFEAGRLAVTGIPEVIPNADAYAFDLFLETNLREEWLAVSADAGWAGVSLDFPAKTVRVTLEANPDTEAREAVVSIGESERRLDAVTVRITQPAGVPPREDLVFFKDPALKAFCVENWDVDGDGEICFDEALIPEEFVAQGRGIKDLTGLEFFKNIHKLDLNGNDIVNADILKELTFLYWLDLRGNARLEHFDVTGCSVYFERCYFDLTEKLHYTCWRGQLGVTQDSDHECTRSLHVRNNDVTTDWTNQDRLVLVQEHTKGDGGVAVVFTGLGYVQRDMEDGSFRRVMDDAMELVFMAPSMTKYKEYMDIYVMEHMWENRYQYTVHYDDLYNKEPHALELKKAFNEVEREGLCKEAYKKLFGNLSADGKLFLYRTDVHTNVFRYGWTDESLSMAVDYPRNTRWYDGWTCVCYTEYAEPPKESSYRFDFRPTREGLMLSERGGDPARYGYEQKSTANFINTVFNENFVHETL